MNDLMRKAIADNKEHGYYFFDKDTKKFWNSKIVAGMYKNNTFVTSEDNYDRTRILYTVRQYDWEKHTVITIGEFQQFETKEEAVAVARRVRKGCTYDA